MSERAVPWAVEQRVIVKFITNENLKPAEILTRLTAQFGDKTPSRTQVYDWSKSFKEGGTDVEKVCEDCTFCRESCGQLLLGFSR
jgi:hypothetical protein